MVHPGGSHCERGEGRCFNVACKILSVQPNFFKRRKRKHENWERAKKELLFHARGDKGLTAVPTDGQQRAAGATEQEEGHFCPSRRQFW